MGSTAAKVITGGFLFGFFLVIISTIGKSFQFVVAITKPFLAVAKFLLTYFSISVSAPSVIGVFLFAVAVGVVYAVLFLIIDLLISFMSKK